MFRNTSFGILIIRNSYYTCVLYTILSNVPISTKLKLALIINFDTPS